MGTSKKAGDKRINNQFWRLAPSTGRKLKYEDAITLEKACFEYFEATAGRCLGKAMISPPFTLAGLCLFLGITDETWRNYRDRKDFFGVIDRVEKIIFVQKFEGAATGIYNANIISRDLGLMDKKQVSTEDVQGQVVLYLPDNGRDKHVQESCKI